MRTIYAARGALSLFAAGLLTESGSAQSARVTIRFQGTVPAQCVSQPARVLVENGVVYVTQYLRCNHPGRFVIRLSDTTKPQWLGTLAKYKQSVKSLDLGVADFNVVPGTGVVETFTIVPKNPAAARDLAANLSTFLQLQ